ncbi:MAG: transporter [Fuerstiella sp.]
MILGIVGTAASLNVVSAQDVPPANFEFRTAESYGRFQTAETIFDQARTDESRPAQQERIETERHDFTQSTKILRPGDAQAEFGYTYFSKNEGSESLEAHATPELLFRYGLTENLEVRLRYNNVWLFGDEDRRGAEDIRFGVKLIASEQRDWLPESAAELRFTAPTGSSDWTTDELEFGLDYIYGWQLAPKVVLYGSTGFSTNALGDFTFVSVDPFDDDFMLYTQSLAVGVELTEQVTLYSEFFGLFTDGFEDDEESPVFFNVGVDYYVNDDFVLDARIGTGLSSDAEDLFVGVGGAYRF